MRFELIYSRAEEKGHPAAVEHASARRRGLQPAESRHGDLKLAAAR
jgi:hypothetical protein